MVKHGNALEDVACKPNAKFWLRSNGARGMEHGTWSTPSIHIAWTRTMHVICSNATDRSCMRPALCLGPSLSLALCKFCANWFVVITENGEGEMRERQGEELRQLLYMSRPKLHISNAPALPIGSIFMPLSRQLATGPTVARLPQLARLSFSVSVCVCLPRFRFSYSFNCSKFNCLVQVRLSLLTFLGAKTMENFSCDWLLKSQSTSTALHSV